MRFKRENWQPTIGDKYALVNFGGITFAWLKHELDDVDVNNNNTDINFEEVTQFTTSDLQSGQASLLNNSDYCVQIISKPMREYNYDGTVVGETTVELLKDRRPTYRYGDR